MGILSEREGDFVKKTSVGFFLRSYFAQEKMDHVLLQVWPIRSLVSICSITHENHLKNNLMILT